METMPESTVVQTDKRRAKTDLDKALVARNLGITIGDEDTNVRAISVQCLDAFGENCKFRQPLRLMVMHGTNEALATGGSTGIAIGAAGMVVATHTAKLVFDLMTSVAGLISFTWTDTGTESVRLRFVLPDGTVRDSAAFANA